MEWDRSDRRRPTRYSFRAQVEGHDAELLVLDLSREGVRLIGDFRPNSDSLELKMELGGLVHRVSGRVAWVRPVGHSGRYQLGLRFEEVVELPNPVPSSPKEPRGALRDLSKEELARLKILASISGDLNKPEYSDDLLSRMMESLVHHLHAERALLLIPSPSGSLSVAQIAGTADQNFSQKVVDQVLETKQPLLSLDAADDIRFEDSQSIQLLGTRSILCVPVLARERCLGLIYLDNSVSVNTFSEAELHLANIVADMAASALERASQLEFMSESQRELAAAHEELHSLVELNSDGLVVFDSNLELRFHNPAAHCYLQGDFSELGKWLSQELSYEELQIRRADGSEGVAAVSMKPTRWCGEQAHLVTLRDITGLKEKDAQLRHSQKMQAVGRLAGGIAHDFNNLLTAILGSCELLSLDTEENQRELRSIQECARRAAGLTQQLLTFCRQRVRTPQTLRLDKVVKSLNGLLLRVLEEDVTLKVTGLDQALTILADEDEIRQLLLNLVLNAREATSRGGLIEIKLRRENRQQGELAVLEVRDTGSGMDKETLERAFEPFFTTKSQGQGLGLSTVYGIVESCGGHLSIKSSPGRGTCVSATLPLITKPNPQEEDSSTSLAQGSGRVILVEDEPAVRNLVLRVLKKSGYEVEAFERAEFALDLELDQFDMLLSDIMLPGMNGLELANHLVEKRPELKVVLMSGYSEGILDMQGGSREAYPFIHKPFEVKELLSTIQAALQE